MLGDVRPPRVAAAAAYRPRRYGANAAHYNRTDQTTEHETIAMRGAASTSCAQYEQEA